MKIFSKLFGDPNEKIIKSLQPIVDEINGLESRFEKMSDEELKGMTGKLKKKFEIGNLKLEIRDSEKEKECKQNLNSQLDSILPEAFAVVREAAKRILGQRHYDVQLMGGIILHRGQITEMKTGEGKTLVATLPLYLNALAGKGVHLVTVNDYLSSIGAGWMSPVYHSLGMTTGVIIHDSALVYDPDFSDDSQYDDRLKHFRPVERKKAYDCDILYGTNNEFGFDYLRDNMAPNLDAMSQRELYYAIVDEVDSILIDEARTPLIISAPAEESTDKYFKFSQLVQKLKENEDYNVDEKMRAVTLSEAGITKMEKWLGVENIYVSGGIREVHHIEQALKANVLFKRDRDYVVQENQVIIVDEFTGRLMRGRRYSEGLHQAIEAKEGVAIQRESQTLATITFQNYFRMYAKLAGMTGTAVTEAEEFSKIYSLETLVVPTNKPMQRNDMNDLIYRSEQGKFKAVIEEIKNRNKKGQPVLVGTISIEKNELLGEMLAREGVQAQILNAKHHEKEAKIIAEAGRFGAVTIATNMAGRGVDIVLEEKVKELGGLHVIGTERHESRRIDNQLRGRAGRQGDPGSSQFYVSMEDDLMRIFGGDRMKNLMATLRVPEDMPIENKIVSRSIESAQKKVEGNNFDIRKHLVEYDDVINKHRESIYKRRREILEIAEHENTKTLGFASKHENTETRKHENTKTQKHESKDDVSHEQRNSSASPQDDSQDLPDIILGMIESEIEHVVGFHTAGDVVSGWNLEEIYQVASTIFPVEEKLKSDLAEFTENQGKLNAVKARTAIIEHLAGLAKSNYEKIENSAKQAGLNWEKIEKAVLIRSIDTLWIEHLEAMAGMRQGIGLRGYGQRDPLIEYKKEAYHLYNELNSLIQKQVVYSIFKVGQVQEFRAPGLADRAKQFSAPAKVMEHGTSSFSGFRQVEASSGTGTRENTKTRKHENSIDLIKSKIKDASGNKVGRNDPCPCGSGKKFKKCCGK
ncbi:preprotein translocase subunit SecA [Patescibacteria group bacterium]|nr:preprotein translocase subunit SecA [Candidatus Falkowbacteria bacterium]MBU3905513.1 preprotein translocase subunit SecA [Patescibacteria group bacterium]MBU4026620.1 preprotein translocase subunit SecA [Patescibacteria group bacterium]MBU4073519.1 preprotein translocase subunit SecA [Patescibacteria group bacterium]MBU4103101.1 preprotein translocase subunit SecA [Patescibacteria group bacterium]